MRHFSIALIYLGFFALIGVAVYLINSALPLWALLLMPSYSNKKDNDDE